MICITSQSKQSHPIAADFGSTGDFSTSSSGALTTGAGDAAAGATTTAGLAFGTTLFLTTWTFLVFISVLPVTGLASGIVYSSSSTTGTTSWVVF